MQNMNCATLVCSREIIYMVLVGQVSWLVENLNIGNISKIIRDKTRRGGECGGVKGGWGGEEGAGGGGGRKMRCGIECGC